jgi:Protease inhibitor Inh
VVRGVNLGSLFAQTKLFTGRNAASSRVHLDFAMMLFEGIRKLMQSVQRRPSTGINDMKPAFALYAQRFGVIALSALVLAGCQSARLDTMSTQPAPAPLPAAPAGTVQQGTLAPVGNGTLAPAAGGTQFPNAPVNPNAPAAGTLTPVTPATPAGTQVASTGGPAVSEDALVGAWKVSTAGSSCQMFMAKTKWSGGFRAASRGCPGDAAAVSAWTVSGSQVILKDSNGNQVATLFSSGGTRFDGTTKSGQPISLSR